MKNKCAFLLFCSSIVLSMAGCRGTVRTDLKTMKFTSFINDGSGWKKTYTINFENNSYVIETLDIATMEFEVTQSGTFSDEKETALIESMNDERLFDIDEEYIDYSIIDGGGWFLNIEFTNGDTLHSKGMNDEPDTFADLAIPFYDFFGDPMLASLPAFYVERPRIDFDVYFKSDSFADYNINISPKEANYKWKASSKDDANVFEINSYNIKNDLLQRNGDYFVTFSTENYLYEKRFKNFTLYSYDFTSDLQNETKLLDTRWFNRKTVKIDLNKIYVYRLTYKDGLFVEYTFNTGQFS